MYIVREERLLNRYFWKDRWLKLTPVQTMPTINNVAIPDTYYWAYWGSEDDVKPNFTFVNPGEVNPLLKELITNEIWGSD